MYSDQPTMPSSVVILRKELTRQPASQCRSSILVIFTELSRSAGGHHAPLRRAGSTPPPFQPSVRLEAEHRGAAHARHEIEPANAKGAKDAQRTRRRSDPIAAIALPLRPSG